MIGHGLFVWWGASAAQIAPPERNESTDTVLTRMLLTSSLGLGLVAGCSGAAWAQATLTAVASVSASATITTTQLDFAVVTAGVDKSIPPRAGLTDGSAGTATVTFNTSQVTVAIPPVMTLTGPGATMVASLSCAWGSSPRATTTTAFPCAAGQAFTSAVAPAQGFVYVGGTISAAESSGKPAGNYAGSVVITAAHAGS